jgi:hypothetical protein
MQTTGDFKILASLRSASPRVEVGLTRYDLEMYQFENVPIRVISTRRSPLQRG